MRRIMRVHIYAFEARRHFIAQAAAYVLQRRLFLPVPVYRQTLAVYVYKRFPDTGLGSILAASTDILL